MKSSDTVARELGDLIQAHYYSEDFELLAAVRAYRDGLEEPERHALRQEIVRRLQSEGSLVDALLCGIIHAPEAVPVLVEMLDREIAPTQLSRALMGALSCYADATAYDAVARFLESDQEREALAALARMDFARALPHIDRRLRKDEFLDACLHILHDRKKKVGLPTFIAEIRNVAHGTTSIFRERLRRALASKVQDYNPFTPDEINVILKALEI